MAEIPEKDHHLYDGFDGGKKPSTEELKALLSEAPEALQARARDWSDAQKKLLYIENEGALFRGPHRGAPTEIWLSHERKFVPYRLAGQPKPIDWGHILSEQEAEQMMGRS